MLCAAGCTNITLKEISNVEFWSNAPNPDEDREILAKLYMEGFLKTHDDSDIFWNCFHDSYKMNPKK